MTQREFLDIVFALVPKEANTIIDAFDEYVESAQLGTNLAQLGTDCISRQDAIDALDKRFDSIPIEQTTEIMLLRKDLREMPPITPIQELLEVSANRDYWKAQCHSYEVTINRLTESTYPEPKRGRWTRDNACSECGYQPWFSGDIHNYSFCPNCGADMRGEQDG